MSRNAIPLQPNGPPMPLWGELAEAMAAEVWPDSPKRRSMDSLLLAEYFERLHKRTALDNFLQRRIRDTEFLPGRLHVLLMALPWADVFTTNYDTLLERASQKVLERRYAVVVNQSDLSSARPPRIVKLNGSFPSHRPLIITQEDFRTYPSKFAAFVNTVQQSIMETAVCMIGFSGNDPNFQAWTGWVRDNLGTAAPPLYHCDVLDLDMAQRSYYESRNIRPIDLGPVFPVGAVPPNRRRAAALEWFLLSLAEDAPVDIERWPGLSRRKPALPMVEALSGALAESSKDRRKPQVATHVVNQPRSATAWEPTDDLPPLVAATQVDTTKTDAVELPSVATAIDKLRRSYPGWLVAPTNSALARAIPDWVRPLTDANTQPSPAELAAVGWTMDVAVWPWPDAFLAKVERALERLAPSGLDADALALVRALVREARERDEPERFEKWMTVLATATSGSPVAVAQWWLERAKFHLSRLELAEAARALLCVTTQPSHPFLDVERAAMLFELGQVEQAAAISAEAVDQLRRHSEMHSSHPRSLGEEATALDLAMTTMFSISFSARAGYARRDELAKSGADPREAIKQFGMDLGEEQARTETLSKDFDPGEWTKSFQYRHGDHSVRPHKVLRAIDVAAQLPTSHKDHVAAAAVAIAVERPGTAFVHLTRVGAKLDGAFSRDRVLALTPDAVRMLWARCARFIEATLESDWNEIGSMYENLRKHALSNAIDLISRLTIRADAEMIAEGLKLACALFESRPFRSLWQLHEILASLFTRLFLVMPLDDQAEALPMLVGLTIPQADEMKHQQRWTDPSSLVASLGQRLGAQRESLTDIVVRLAAVLRNEDGIARTAAVSRLDALDRGGGLGDAAKRAYVDALWSHADADGGIPVVEGFSLHLGLLVSAGYPDALSRFKAWALGGSLPLLFSTRTQHGRTLRQSQGHWVARHMRAIERATLLPWSEGDHVSSLIDWTQSEAAVLLRQLVSWVEQLRIALPEGSPDLNERDVVVVNDVAEFVSRALVPRIDSSDAGIRTLLDSINNTLVELKCVPPSMHPTWLSVNPEAPVEADLRADLTSEHDEAVRRAIGWVYEWVRFAKGGRISAPPADLVDHIFLLTSLAPTRSRSLAFSTAYSLYIEDQALLTDQRRGWITVALERLFRARSVPLGKASIPFTGDLKAAAARLLTALAIREPSVEPWKTLRPTASSDAYPEVRRACEEVEEELS